MEIGSTAAVNGTRTKKDKVEEGVEKMKKMDG